MKTLLKTISLLALIFTVFACDNDADPSPNDAQCNYQGLTFLDTASNTQTLIPETDLTTGHITAGSNGPEVEVRETANPGNFNFVTTVVTQGASGTGTLNYNGTTYSVNVTCQRGVTGSTGSVVGDEYRFDITASGIEIELCVVQDELTLGYIDADGDGCGSQTVSYTVGVLNNVDINDGDASVCM